MHSDARITAAIDAGPLIDRQTGVGRYVRELMPCLQACGVDLKPYAIAWRGRSDEGIRRIRAPARVVQFLWRLRWPPIEAIVGKVSLVHATNFVLPPSRSARGVV